eukprot:TRINITY_DN34763_c0_g1_i2.p1 TRINITY_DN34763_c0_g1~~TRINITY_DN34763_c0_g1_i2.p1  ORF type:complete len:254 (+),score=40.68 TRINITY_DN34763_c0_g1_i2:28-762(+)
MTQAQRHRHKQRIRYGWLLSAVAAIAGKSATWLFQARGSSLGSRSSFACFSLPRDLPQPDGGASNQGSKVLLRVCGKCIGRRGFDPTPGLIQELKARCTANRSTPNIEIDSGSCMGPCADGPNIQLLTEVEVGFPKIATASAMMPREKTYRCLLGVVDQAKCGRACDLAFSLVEELAKNPDGLPTEPAETAFEQKVSDEISDDEKKAQEKERAARIAKELRDSRAYLAEREKTAGAANWRERCR